MQCKIKPKYVLNFDLKTVIGLGQRSQVLLSHSLEIFCGAEFQAEIKRALFCWGAGMQLQHAEVPEPETEPASQQ